MIRISGPIKDENVNNYRERLEGAVSFAGPLDVVDDETWLSLFDMGLALANLDRVVGESLQPELHWAELLYRGNGTFQAFWIVERDYFAKMLK